MGLLIPVAIILILVAMAITKKLKFNDLSQEDKDIYNGAVGKLGDLNKKRKRFPLVGLITYIALMIIGYIVLKITNQPQETSLGPIVRTCEATIINILVSLSQLYIFGYAFALIVFEKIYVKKCIKESNVLSEKEKSLLKEFYIKSTPKIISLTVLAQIIPVVIKLINATADKPIIYIYPDEKKKVTVRVGNPENLIHAYPEYNQGWEVEADVDGALTDANGKKYYSLYWEGINKVRVDEKIGFCVKGEDTAKFLEEKLEALGLNYKEREEFIVYWLPQMENNRYNYVYFMQTNEVDTVMPLEINPKPETLIRIMMYYKPLFREVSLQKQVLKPVERTGYTVVEWGGTKIR